jgi:hypothetical protein
MNYEQLKALDPDLLLDTLKRQVEHAIETPIALHIMRDNLDGLTAPTLFYLGDFEIRARFNAPNPTEVYVGDPTGSCSALGSGQLPPIHSLRGIFKPL